MFRSFSTKAAAEEFLSHHQPAANDPHTKTKGYPDKNRKRPLAQITEQRYSEIKLQKDGDRLSVTKKTKSSKFYAVAIGKNAGVYESWSECQVQTEGFSKALYKSFPTRIAAEEFVSQYLSTAKKGEQTSKPSTISSNLENEQVNLKKKSERVSQYITVSMKMFFDGGSRGNGRHKDPVAGSGALLDVSIANIGTQSPTTTRKMIRKYLDKKTVSSVLTNNVAEYYGLIVGLSAAKEYLEEFVADRNKDESAKGQNIKITLLVKGDSLLIINQVTGAFKCKDKNLIPIYKDVMRKINELNECGVKLDFKHVLREFNADADALANEAMNQKRSWTTTTCIDVR